MAPAALLIMGLCITLYPATMGRHQHRQHEDTKETIQHSHSAFPGDVSTQFVRFFLFFFGTAGSGLHERDDPWMVWRYGKHDFFRFRHKQAGGGTDDADQLLQSLGLLAKPRIAVAYFSFSPRLEARAREGKPFRPWRLLHKKGGIGYGVLKRGRVDPAVCSWFPGGRGSKKVHKPSLTAEET